MQKIPFILNHLFRTQTNDMERSCVRIQITVITKQQILHVACIHTEKIMAVHTIKEQRSRMYAGRAEGRILNMCSCGRQEKHKTR